MSSQFSYSTAWYNFGDAYPKYSENRAFDLNLLRLVRSLTPDEITSVVAYVWENVESVKVPDPVFLGYHPFFKSAVNKSFLSFYSSNFF